MDEVGTLAREFNRMADSLSEKNYQLEEANRLLELRVSIRTNELKEANDQLLEMQEQVVHNERLAAIGALSAGVAHDLRNPLGAIRNGVYFLNKKMRASEFARNEPKVSEFLAVIDERVSHCDKIITDLITFSRIAIPCYSSINLHTTIDYAISGVESPEYISVVRAIWRGGTLGKGRPGTDSAGVFEPRAKRIRVHAGRRDLDYRNRIVRLDNPNIVSRRR